MQAFFFGPAERALFGALHAAPSSASGSVLVCTPLFQEGVRLHRALWALAESLAASGLETLRFDWSGSGDSDGDAASTTFDAWLNDVRVAEATLRGPGAGDVRVLAARSAALPVLAQIERARQPVDLVLWDPCLHGSGLLSEWRRQDRVQFDGSGRYTQGHPTPAATDLCGFDVHPSVIAGLDAVDARRSALPAGSRLLLAAWDTAPLDAFVAANRDAGNAVDVLLLDAADRPAWDDAAVIESQIFPRRSVAAVARKIAGDRA
jgi:uncharacterized protein